MNRCPDCGGEIIEQLCDTCGLTPAAAEFALRRRLLYGTAIFLLGALAFLPAAHYYPPLELDLMLIFLGIVAFIALTGAFWLDRSARRHNTSQVMKRFLYGLLPVPWMLAALLWVNGRFDVSTPTVHVARVVGTFAMPGTLRSSRVVVVSWREGRRIERVPISRDEYVRFRRGDTAEIRLQEGLVGIPWVLAVYRK
jgi:hypothetical protein